MQLVEIENMVDYLEQAATACQREHELCQARRKAERRVYRGGDAAYWRDRGVPFGKLEKHLRKIAEEARNLLSE